MPRLPSVLVVDDDEDIRDVVEDLLSDRGFEIRQASSLDEARRELSARDFDTLLCRIEFLRSADPEFLPGPPAGATRPRIRVVAMSAGDAYALRDEADANLAKPFTRRELLAALRPAGA